MALLVQSKSGSGSGTSLTVTLTSATTIGNCLVVCTGGIGTSTVSNIKLGGASDNLASAKSTSVASFSTSLEDTWTDQNIGVSSASVVITFSGSMTNSLAWVLEFSGIQASSAVDKTNSGTGTSSTFSSGSSGSLTNTKEVVIGASVAGTVTGTVSQSGPTSPWNNLAQVQAGSASLIVGYQIVSANAALTYSGSLSGGNGVFDSAATIVSLLQAAPLASHPLTLNQAVMRSALW